jgi:hypothetical protein
VERVTKEELEEFLKRQGKQGEMVLSTLGKLKPFVDCMNTEIGATLLSSLVQRYEVLLNKASDVAITDEEKYELKALKHIILTYAQQINAYSNRIDLIKGKDKRAR